MFADDETRDEGRDFLVEDDVESSEKEDEEEDAPLGGETEEEGYE